ncbi:ankyrin repeat domain-containing protein [Endozoicomonas sp. YOMI1]|uniref:ankyrin repeat domain-containing protein n=1 Tax=Endozoicomonas sp. YOMI1 TaxID=2828739 RepID=UPI002148CC38|nr:ankyrin repeat domain-containing protein [Endozoicomonas sp. YOMI1]
MNSLEYAVDCGDHAMVKTLLDKGADPNIIIGNCNETPLHRAVKAGQHAIVETLLTYGADPKLKDRKGRTALQRAVAKGHLNVYKTLLSITHQPDWDSLLQEFSCSGWKDQVEAALAKGANPNNQDSYRNTPLGKAATVGCQAIVETLLANGANPNIPGCNDYTPLHYAADNGYHAIVTTLLEKGADADLKNRYGLTALQHAAVHGHLDVYKTLLPKTHQPDWDSLLLTFSRSRWKDQVEAALAKGANPNYQDSNSYTPLERATIHGCHAIVEILLANGADPNIPGFNDYTPLHHAADQGHYAIVEILLASGADPNIPGFNDYTPLHHAADQGHYAIVKILLANGANPNLKHSLGKTALQCAGPAIKEIIQNFMSVPRLPSLQSCCRASIRSRLIKGLAGNGPPMKKALDSLELPEPMYRYVYHPLSL